MRICSVEGCNNKHKAKGYCGKHYKKLLKFNDVNHGVEYEKHNKQNEDEYRIWAAVKSRCLNKKSSNYKYYGGRGITICERWRNSFQNFWDDMGPRPNKDYSIDRINNDKGYSKENCRWTDKTEQARNQRLSSLNKSGCKGVSWNEKSKKWEANITIFKKREYLGQFENLDDAIEARKKAENKYWK